MSLLLELSPRKRICFAIVYGRQLIAVEKVFLPTVADFHPLRWHKRMQAMSSEQYLALGTLNLERGRTSVRYPWVLQHLTQWFRSHWTLVTS